METTIYYRYGVAVTLDQLRSEHAADCRRYFPEDPEPANHPFDDWLSQELTDGDLVAVTVITEVWP